MSFINDSFLLQSDSAQRLYHDFAEHQAIIDYHNHLSPVDVANNRHFGNLTQAWLEGDHYKWRAMRANGIDEQYITGAAPAEEKFRKWAETVPKTLRNPLYHWTHLELARYFDVNELLNKENADSIYAKCSEQLLQNGAQDLLKKMSVKLICTTDDPIDSLNHHKAVQLASDSVAMYPTFRPDRALGLSSAQSYNSYLDELSIASGVEISCLDDLLDALNKRAEYFAEHGCRLSDFGLSHMPFMSINKMQLETSFKKIRVNRETLDTPEITALQSFVLIELGKIYHRLGWVQQLHLGVIRNNNSRAYRELGPDTGFDSMGDAPQALSLAKFLDALDNTNQLPKTVLYNLNPADNEMFATMAGNFNDGTEVGKIQFGSGWWFLDQKTGMEAQINTLSNMGLLSNFIGMLTDSRSFLSFTRHEYFRRILCNLLAEDMNKGLLPRDFSLIGSMVSDICYNNVNKYFGFGL